MRLTRHGYPYRRNRYFTLAGKRAFEHARRGRRLSVIADLADVSYYSLADYLYHGNGAPLEKAYAICDALNLPFEELWKEKTK